MYNDSMIIFSQDFPNSQELSVLMTFGFSDGSRNFRKSLPFPEEFPFCTDKVDSVEWLDLVQRLSIDDCYEIHRLH